MSSQVPPKTTRSGRAPKDSEKKRRMQETEAMELAAPGKRKRNAANKENQHASKGKAPEFQVTPIANNSTSLKGVPVNLQARKAGLPIPRSSATPAPKPAKNVAGQRRVETPVSTSRKLTPDKAAQLAAARNPFGVAPTGRNGVLSSSARQSATSTTGHVSQPGGKPSSPTAGPSRSRQTPATGKPRVSSPATMADIRMHAPSQGRHTGAAKRADQRASVPNTDELYASDNASDYQAPYAAHVRVSKIQIQAPEDDNDYLEDKAAGIPRESWISSRLRERTKNALVLLPSGVIGEYQNTFVGSPKMGAEDDEYSDGLRSDDDDTDIPHECPQQDDLPEENEQDEFGDILREDEHIGEFDDAPDEDEAPVWHHITRLLS